DPGHRGPPEEDLRPALRRCGEGEDEALRQRDCQESVTVDTTTGYTENLEALRAAQKPARGTAAYGRYVNRPAGRVVAAWAHTVGMTPNVATAISAVLSGSGLVLIALARPSLL